VKKIFVSSIKDRDQVDSVFLVKDKITAMAKNGKPYLTLRLMDKTGEVDCKIWDNVDLMSSLFDKDDFVFVRSRASVYLGKLQLVISELQKVVESDVALGDFLPETERDIQEMVAQFGNLIDTLSDPHLKGLMTSFLTDEPFMSRYRTAPAAKGMHHVYLGGLLEHSLSVACLVDSIVPLYEGLNRDLLVVGALLHDVGKVREMSYYRSFDYTDEGKLLGHITIGVEMVQEKIASLPGFPAELAMLLKHMLLSHHGQYEFGSPKRPKTLDATILNYLDDLDSKINGIQTHFRKEPHNPSNWSSYHRLYDRYFYRDSLSCDEVCVIPEPAAPCTPEPAEPAFPAGEKPSVRTEADSPRRGDKRAGFQNNPFANLSGNNLELFSKDPQE
jgi:3'-5' exoribonuclease